VHDAGGSNYAGATSQDDPFPYRDRRQEEIMDLHRPGGTRGLTLEKTLLPYIEYFDQYQCWILPMIS
jgi:hypothetical protein